MNRQSRAPVNVSVLERQKAAGWMAEHSLCCATKQQVRCHIIRGTEDQNVKLAIAYIPIDAGRTGAHHEVSALSRDCILIR